MPNLNAPSNVEAKLARIELTTSSQTVFTTPAAKVSRVVSVIATNIDGTNNADVTIATTDGSTAIDLLKTVVVPADASLVAISRDNILYVPAGSSLTALASANGDIVLHVSYEEIS